MLTLFHKTVVLVLAIGLLVIAFVLASKTNVAAAPVIAPPPAPVTLVAPGAQAPPPGIVATGEAKLAYHPDVAYLTLGSVSQAPSAQTAQARLSERIANLLARAKDLGIADRDIAHAAYNIQPQYTYAQNQPPRLSGYEASQQVLVTLRDVTGVGKALDELLKDDAATTPSVRFALASGRDPQLDARQRAIEDARAKAEAMARAAGVRLGAAVSVIEAGSDPRAPVYVNRTTFTKNVKPVVPTGDIDLVMRLQVQFTIVGP